MDDYIFKKEDFMHVHTVFDSTDTESNIIISEEGTLATQKKLCARSFVQAEYIMRNNPNGPKKFCYHIDIQGHGYTENK